MPKCPVCQSTGRRHLARKHYVITPFGKEPDIRTTYRCTACRRFFTESNARRAFSGCKYAASWMLNVVRYLRENRGEVNMTKLAAWYPIPVTTIFDWETFIGSRTQKEIEGMFEQFTRGTEPRCHSCNEPLIDVKSAGYPPGHGEFRGFCEDCELYTWFDWISSSLGVAGRGEGD